MKKLLMMLLGVAFFAPNAFSQTNNNSKVCTHKGNVVSCQKCVDKTDKNTSVRNYDVDVYVVTSNKKNPRLKASYDRPGDAYEGKEVMINDGVQANIARNINYMDQSVVHPTNDGEVNRRY